MTNPSSTIPSPPYRGAGPAAARWRAMWRHVGAPTLSTKLALAFAGVAVVVAAYAATAIAVHFSVVEHAARLEAQHVAELIADVVLESGLSAPAVRAYIARLDAIGKRDVVVVDSHGIGIADANVDEIGQPFDGDPGGEVRRTLADGRIRTFIETNASQPAGAFQIVVPIRDPAGRSIVGGVVLEYSGIRTALLDASRSELDTIAAAGGLVLLLVMGSGVAIARRVTKPLRTLTRSVQRLAAHDYTARVDIASRDEIGALGMAFNRMAEDLRIGNAALLSHQLALEQRVADRTCEVNETNTRLMEEIGQRSWEATHDAQTGLVNRQEFGRRVEQSLRVAKESGQGHVVAYLDLDQFKVINDTCGHQAGDEMLKQVSDLLTGRLRKSDTLARLGGDEFGVLLEGCALDRALSIAADLLAAIGDYRFHCSGKMFAIGVSIGLAVVDGDDAVAEVLSMADTACHWAKEQGRNRVCAYRAGDSDMAVRRREVGWIARLTQALEDDRFILFHQTYLPLTGPDGGRTHLEVLLRMIDEEGALVQPGSFIPAAERYNLMPALDRWVVRTVFRHYGALMERFGGGPLTCAINLSGTSINADGFLAFVRQQALEHRLPAGSICFEITETVAINNLRHATEFVRECKLLGFLFALDDFGTGTSSFGYLKTLPVDYLKIDGGFVRNLENDEVDKAMTETINRIGHIMNIRTVAEYAENDGIIAALRAMGVDYAQGYGVCKPTPLLAGFDLPRMPTAERATVDAGAEAASG